MTSTEPATRSGAAIAGIDLSAYYVSDPARAIAFYRDVLGLTPTEIDEEASMPSCYHVRPGGPDWSRRDRPGPGLVDILGRSLEAPWARKPA